MSLINVTFISNTGSDLTGNNKSFGYQKEKKKISTTPLDPEHLKVKDIEQDINLTKKLLHHYQHAKNQLNSKI